LWEWQKSQNTKPLELAQIIQMSDNILVTMKRKQLKLKFSNHKSSQLNIRVMEIDKIKQIECQHYQIMDIEKISIAVKLQLKFDCIVILSYCCPASLRLGLIYPTNYCLS
jgi:sulfate adenylyltransferase subunit 1 (EFTu-like GTPase family)